MKILFSPSEAKSQNSPITSPLKYNLSFEKLFNIRLDVIEKYNYFIQHASDEELSKLIGIKDTKELETYKNLDILNAPLQQAILRYTGVGYKYLDFSSLNKEEQDIALNSIIIFSNLFGPVLAKDALPHYKLKQGENIGSFIPYKYYQERCNETLDEFLEGEFIVDLRASFYEKFYKPKHDRIVLKFLKNGKSVSHFAKAYRGLIARVLCKFNPQNENEFKDIPIPDLEIKEIQSKKETTIYIYEIMQ